MRFPVAEVVKTFDGRARDIEILGEFRYGVHNGVALAGVQMRVRLKLLDRFDSGHVVDGKGPVVLESVCCGTDEHQYAAQAKP